MARLSGTAATFRDSTDHDVVMTESERSILAQLLQRDSVLPLQYSTLATVLHCDQLSLSLETQEGQVGAHNELPSVLSRRTCR